ncbi:MAG: helix-turn-helix domain-containing protein [Clostridia bacterium]|nr:helix-turn-helix domain-containing protein [Clostridia bacterium]MDD4048131.1 helix-turn-helix domain-containing protein [Clostridia bacterium]
MVEKFEGINQRLTEKMNILNLKQKDVCKITNISKNAMSNYVNGNRIPDTLAIYKLSKALNVSIEWLLTGEAVPTNENASQHNYKFSALDLEILKLSHELDVRDQKEIYDIILLKHKRVQQEKRGLSLTSTNGNKDTG